MKDFILKSPFGTAVLALNVANASALSQAILDHLGLKQTDVFLHSNGRPLCDDICSDDAAFSVVHASLRLLGGKGGFGSLMKSKRVFLRNQNQDACRTLDGRRLRAQVTEEAVRKHIDTAEERKRKREEELKEKEELKRRRKEEKEMAKRDLVAEQATHERIKTLDSVFESARENTKESVTVALQQAYSSQPSQPPAKKAKWADELYGLEEEEEDEDSSSGSEAEETAEGPSQDRSSPDTFAHDITLLGNTVLPKKQLDAPEGSTSTSVTRTQASSSSSSSHSNNSNARTVLPRTLEGMMGLGLERLKAELSNRFLKCGGTLQQRAERLLRCSALPWDKIPKRDRGKMKL